MRREKGEWTLHSHTVCVLVTSVGDLPAVRKQEWRCGVFCCGFSLFTYLYQAIISGGQ